MVGVIRATVSVFTAVLTYAFFWGQIQGVVALLTAEVMRASFPVFTMIPSGFIRLLFPAAKAFRIEKTGTASVLKLTILIFREFLLILVEKTLMEVIRAAVPIILITLFLTAARILFVE